MGNGYYVTLAGIDSEGPGYKRIRIQPFFDDQFTSAATGYDSSHDLIATQWSRAEKQILLSMTIPANTTDTVLLPAAEAEGSIFIGRAQGTTL